MDHVGQVGYELGQGGVRGWAERTRVEATEVGVALLACRVEMAGGRR